MGYISKENDGQTSTSTNMKNLPIGKYYEISNITTRTNTKLKQFQLVITKMYLCHNLVGVG